MFFVIILCGKKEVIIFLVFYLKNVLVKVFVIGEWVLKECEVFNYYFIIILFKLYKWVL